MSEVKCPTCLDTGCLNGGNIGDYEPCPCTMKPAPKCEPRVMGAFVENLPSESAPKWDDGQTYDECSRCGCVECICNLHPSEPEKRETSADIPAESVKPARRGSTVCVHGQATGTYCAWCETKPSPKCAECDCVVSKEAYERVSAELAEANERAERYRSALDSLVYDINIIPEATMLQRDYIAYISKPARETLK